jgi:arabinose-5-phosphate isomerase
MPKRIAPNALAIDALDLMRKHSITQLIVAEGDTYLGMVHLHDLVREGLV